MRTVAERETVEIRRLGSDEVDVVARFLGLARLHQGDGYYLVAWRGGEPVGHLHLAMTAPPELQDVSVRPEHRRRGVATALTAAAELEVGRLGFAAVRLCVSTDNSAAQALYRARGYGDVGLPPRRVQGTVHLRTGPVEVDDTLLTWEKALPGHG